MGNKINRHDPATAIPILEKQINSLNKSQEQIREEIKDMGDSAVPQNLYLVSIYATRGNLLKGGIDSTVLQASLYSWDINITADTPADYFTWTRNSGNVNADEEWNAANGKGKKSITVIKEDVGEQSTFLCTVNDNNKLYAQAQIIVSSNYVLEDAVVEIEQIKQAATNAETSAREAKEAAQEAQTKADSAVSQMDAVNAEIDATNQEVETLKGNLQTLSETLEADYATKGELTNIDTSLKAEIQKNAGQISSVVTRVDDIEIDADKAIADAEAAAQAAQTAQDKADTAQRNYEILKQQADATDAELTQAKLDLEAAEKEASEAKTAATNAQSVADQAQAAATLAQTAADNADAKAVKATEDLVKAEQNLADVTSRVGATEEDVKKAQADVESAKATANQAKTDANNAQSVADQAKTEAETAKQTADTAKANAQTAQEAAETAKANAETAQNVADQAKAAANNAQTTANSAQAAAQAAQNAADTAQAAADSLTDRVTTAETNITQNDNEIKLLATHLEENYLTSEETASNIAENAAQILATAEEVTLGILAGYTKTSDLEAYKKEVKNLLKVNEEGVSMEFEQMAAKLNELGGEITTQKQYIRFIEGSIYIGHSDSPYSSVYTNDTLEFRYNDQMVARFTNEVLEVRNISAENQVAWFQQWAIRKGAYIDGVGYNLNDTWIGG